MPLGVGLAGDGVPPGAGGSNPETTPLAGGAYDDTVTHAFGVVYTAGSHRRMVIVQGDCNPSAFMGWTKFTSGGNAFMPGGYEAGNGANAAKTTCMMMIVVDPSTDYEAKKTGTVAIRTWIEIDL